MNKIRLTICDTEYLLNAEESEEYMQALAEKVDASMRQMMENPRVSLSMAAVLTALNAQDELEKALASADNLRAQMKDYLNDSARAEVDRLRQENAQLRARLGGR